MTGNFLPKTLTAMITKVTLCVLHLLLCVKVKLVYIVEKLG